MDGEGRTGPLGTFTMATPESDWFALRISHAPSRVRVVGPFSASAYARNELHVELGATGDLGGKLLLPEGEEPLGWSVGLALRNVTISDEQRMVHSTSVDSHGGFEFEGVPVGHYDLFASTSALARSQRVDASAVAGAFAGLAIRAGECTDQDLDLRPQFNVRLFGQVPEAWFVVDAHLVPANEAELCARPVWARSTTPRLDGTFRLLSPSIGRHTLRLHGDGLDVEQELELRAGDNTWTPTLEFGRLRILQSSAEPPVGRSVSVSWEGGEGLRGELTSNLGSSDEVTEVELPVGNADLQLLHDDGRGNRRGSLHVASGELFTLDPHTFGEPLPRR